VKKKPAPWLARGSDGAQQEISDPPIHHPASNHQPIFCVRLQARPGTDAIRALRALLKRAWRDHRMRAITAIEVSGNPKQPNKRRSKTMMNDLSAFRASANKMRSSTRAFDGDFVSFKNDGQWLAGKAKKDLGDRRLVADVYNLIHGWQKYKDEKYVYAGHSFVRDNKQLLARDKLDERNDNLWKNKNEDPWKPTYYLGMFDPETREQFIYTTSTLGGKDALAVLQDAFADHNEAKAQYELPIIELASDSYINQQKKTIFKPIFDNVGWCERPPTFRALKLPASALPPAIEHKPGEAKAQQQRGDMDDENPF
jgi:hypothetical protein